MKSGKTLTIEETITDKKGKKIIYLSLKQPLRNQKKEIIGLVGVSIDISKRKKAEQNKPIGRQAYEQTLAAKEEALQEQEKKKATLRSKEQAKFLRSSMMSCFVMLSNDLKNPLHSSGFAVDMTVFRLAVLQEKYGLTEEELKEIYNYLDIVRGNNKTMTAIIESATCQIEQIASQDPQPVLEAFSVQSLIERSLQNYQKDLKNGLIDCMIQKEIWLKVDRVFFGQIMTNLIENAKKQIALKAQGQIFIFVHTDRNHCFIDIKDTSGGLSQADIDAVFVRYKTEEGMGIGWLSSQLLMRQMNGVLTAHLVDKDCLMIRLKFCIR